MAHTPCLARQLTADLDERVDDAVLDDLAGFTWSHGQLWARAATIVAVLVDHGVSPGDRVLVQVAKSPDALALYLACVRHGAVFCPINPSCPPAETDAYADDADPALVVVAPEAHQPAGRRALTLGGDGTGSLPAAADAARPRWSIVDRGPDELAALLFTSGTTGRPKGAMITDANLVANGWALVEAWRWRRDDVLLHALPTFHVHGLFVAVHCALLGRSSMIWLPQFDVDAVIDALPRATVMMGVPTYYSRLLADDRLDRQRCHGVRLFTSGSAPMTDAVHDAFTTRTGHRIVERYGMTETGILTTNPYEGDRRPGTVGFPLPDVEVRVVPTDDGSSGTTGIVQVRGPGVFAGYWQRPDATDDSFTADGWFVTGDVGAVDVEGRLRLEGRAGDMIISGGENVYPREIELVLDEVDGVAESAVVGVPDDDLGERVVAVVVADGDPPPESNLRRALDGRLARFKHPKRIVWVDALPRNTMGKVQKHLLRAELG